MMAPNERFASFSNQNSNSTNEPIVMETQHNEDQKRNLIFLSQKNTWKQRFGLKTPSLTKNGTREYKKRKDISLLYKNDLTLKNLDSKGHFNKKNSLHDSKKFNLSSGEKSSNKSSLNSPFSNIDYGKNKQNDTIKTSNIIHGNDQLSKTLKKETNNNPHNENNWNNYLIKVTLETKVNLHTLQCLGFRHKGHYYISVFIDKDCRSNYIEDSYFVKHSLLVNDGQIEINKVNSDIFKVNHKDDKIALHKKFTIISHLLYDPIEFNNAINTDVPIAININLHRSIDDSTEKYMIKCLTCKVRLSTFGYCYCSFNEFIHFPVSYPALLNMTTHSCITKIVPVIYTQSDVDILEYIELDSKLIVDNPKWAPILLSLVDALIYSLNLLICSYDTFAIQFSDKSNFSSKNEKLKKYIESSIYNTKRKNFFIENIGQGKLDYSEILNVLDDIHNSIACIWTNYMIEIDLNPQLIFYIGLLSFEHRLNTDLFTNLIFSTNLQTDILRYQDFKNALKKLKNSNYYNVLMYNPIHQLSSDHIINSQRQNGKIDEKNINGNSIFQLHRRHHATVIIEENCSVKSFPENHYVKNNNFYKRKHYLLDHKLGFTDFSLYNTTNLNTLGSSNTISKQSEDGSIIRMGLCTKIKNDDISFFDCFYQDLHGRKYDKLHQTSLHSPQYFSQTKNDNLSQIYHKKYNIMMCYLRNIGFSADYNSTTNSQSYNNLNHLLDDSRISNFDFTSKISASSNNIPNNCDKLLHCVIYVPGLQGSYLDLLNYRNIIANMAKNIFSIMPKNNNKHNASIYEQARCILDEIIVHMPPLDKIQKISFVSYSLGCLITRAIIELERFQKFIPYIYTFLSISGPHLGIAYHSNLYSIGSWFIKKITKSQSMEELSLSDHEQPEKKILYILSKQKNLNRFQNIILISSHQDQVVPSHSARIEMCKGAYSRTTTAHLYQNMLRNIMDHLCKNQSITIMRFEISFSEYDLQNHSSFLMKGKAAHLAVLDFKFVQRFMRSHGLQFF